MLDSRAKLTLGAIFFLAAASAAALLVASGERERRGASGAAEAPAAEAEGSRSTEASLASEPSAGARAALPWANPFEELIRAFQARDHAALEGALRAISKFEHPDFLGWLFSELCSAPLERAYVTAIAIASRQEPEAENEIQRRLQTPSSEECRERLWKCLELQVFFHDDPAERCGKLERLLRGFDREKLPEEDRGKMDIIIEEFRCGAAALAWSGISPEDVRRSPEGFFEAFFAVPKAHREAFVDAITSNLTPFELQRVFEHIAARERSLPLEDDPMSHLARAMARRFDGLSLLEDWIWNADADHLTQYALIEGVASFDSPLSYRVLKNVISEGHRPAGVTGRSLTGISKMQEWEDTGRLIKDYLDESEKAGNVEAAGAAYGATLNLIGQEFGRKKTLDASLGPARWYLLRCTQEDVLDEFIGFMSQMNYPREVFQILHADLLECAARVKSETIAAKIQKLLNP